MSNIQINKRSTFTGHTSGIYDLKALNNHEFLSAGGDGQIVKWNLQDFDNGQLIARVHSNVYGICVDDSRALIGENSRAIHMINLKNSEVMRSVEVKSPVFVIERINDHYFVGTGAGELLIFDLSLDYVQKFQYSSKSLRTISANETDIALGYSDNIIRILNRKSLKVKYEISEHKLSVFSVIYHPKTNELISTGRDAQIKIWNTDNHYQVSKSIAAHMNASNHLVFHPQLNYLASGSMDKSIKIWDGTTFALLKVIDKARYEGHRNSVNRLLWMDFDNLLVTCSDDQTIAVWDIKFD